MVAQALLISLVGMLVVGTVLGLNYFLIILIGKFDLLFEARDPAKKKEQAIKALTSEHVGLAKTNHNLHDLHIEKNSEMSPEVVTAIMSAVDAYELES